MTDEHGDDVGLKMKDFTEEVKAKVPEYSEPAQKDHKLLPEALEKLLALEKKTRLAADSPSTQKLVKVILELCVECEDWKALNQHITLLCKRRAQLKKVIANIVKDSMEYINKTPDDEVKMALIETLRSVSEGKIMVELERARLTRELAQMKETAGKISDAAEILQEVAVETVGSMEVREKADFLLEQIRLCLANNDFIRAEIITKKVKTETLAKEDFQDLKLKFYRLMIKFYSHSDQYLSCCQAYKHIFQTKSVQEDKAQWSEALKSSVIFLALSPFDAEVSDLLYRLKAEKKIQELPSCKSLLDMFTTDELCEWPFAWQDEWKQDPIFTDADKGAQRWEDLHKRSIQHNLRVISKYYGRVRMTRLSQLLDLAEDKAEKFISEMVSSKQLFAKIDRPSGIIVFDRTQDANVTLNAWAGDFSTLLDKVEKTCHLINKENMVHKIK